MHNRKVIIAKCSVAHSTLVDVQFSVVLQRIHFEYVLHFAQYTQLLNPDTGTAPGQLLIYKQKLMHAEAGRLL